MFPQGPNKDGSYYSLACEVLRVVGLKMPRRSKNRARWLRALGQHYEAKESWEECVSTTHYRVALDRGAGTGYTG